MGDRMGDRIEERAADEAAGRPLSVRELQIAQLAAEGLSNRSVAERLVLSERTVENHLHRVYRALGISGRAELGEALRRLGGLDVG